ncbi:hypothetical protein, partial [Staphylococcus epidermidis]|uniref:hypothetical protein n=1 Tax=Staphylococcus epidermidis TaxID=1282 RepID=UPI001C92E0D0
VEYCENRLLERYGNRLLLPDHVPVTASPALAPLDEADAAALEAAVRAGQDEAARIGELFASEELLLAAHELETEGPLREELVEQ